MENQFLEKVLEEELLTEEEEMSMDSKKKCDYATLIEEELAEMPFMFKEKRLEDGMRFEIAMPSDQFLDLRVKMIVGRNGDTKIRCFLAKNVPPENIPALREAINCLNSEYRFICLSIDEDRDICASYDFILVGDKEVAGRQAATSLVLFADIASDCLPVLMPLVWKRGSGASDLIMKTNLFADEGGAEE